MATRKKKKPIKAPRTLAAFVVVLEDLNSKFKVFGEGLQGVRDELREFRGEVDLRFEAVDRRFDAVDARSDRTDGELALVKAAVLENNRELKELRGAVTRMVNRDEVEAIVARALTR